MWCYMPARSRCIKARIYNFVVQPQIGIVRINFYFSMDPCGFKVLNIQFFHMVLRIGAL